MVVTCLRAIGAGGFCEVWRATDAVLTRPVAVKLLHAGYAHQPEARQRNVKGRSSMNKAQLARALGR